MLIYLKFQVAHRHSEHLQPETNTGATDAALNLMMQVDSNDFFDNMFEAETKRQRCKQTLGYSMSCTGVSKWTFSTNYIIVIKS